VYQKIRESFCSLLFFMQKGLEPSKCSSPVDCCSPGRAPATPLFSFAHRRKKMQTSPFRCVPSFNQVGTRTNQIQKKQDSDWDLAPLHLFSGRIRFLLVRQSKKIIHADMVKLRQGDQNLGRDHAFTAFVIGVGSLGNIDSFSKLCLRKV